MSFDMSCDHTTMLGGQCVDCLELAEAIIGGLRSRLATAEREIEALEALRRAARTLHDAETSQACTAEMIEGLRGDMLKTALEYAAAVREPPMCWARSDEG